MDFTETVYQRLILSLQNAGYAFQSFSAYLKENREKTVILRHDVDRLPNNALVFARIQANLGIRASYYFRAVEASWNEKLIKEIASMGHEVGYHYESLSTIADKTLWWQKNRNVDQLLEEGIIDFENNLKRLRKITSVETICMHGSPTSRFDSKALWEKYNYNDFGIIGEPYFDVDFEEVFYLTDTGRCWNGYKVSVRDKIPELQKHWEKQGLIFKTTFDLIEAANNNRLPNSIMMTFHPQRWHSNSYLWAKELILQNLKNQIKRGLILLRAS